jgi:hypothetical protein
MPRHLLLLIAVLVSLPLAGHAQDAAPTPFQQAQRLNAAGRFAEAIPLLERLTAEGPANGPAWIALGRARRGLAQVDGAASAFERARAIAATSRPATVQLFLLYADAVRADDAFRLMRAVRLAGIDLSQVAQQPEVAKLHDDERFRTLFPDRIAFDPPFVEGARVIHEWRGEARGDEFGWIARGVGDVDGDGITDVVISATANPPTGSTRGMVYVYSGRSGTLLWKVVGDSGSVLGTGLESAGDVDADGVQDVVAGAPGINSVFVFSGRDGAQLLRLTGDAASGGLGSAVSGIGDFDHDGHDDIVAGAPGGNAHGPNAGRAIVYSGKDGHPLLTIDGDSAGHSFGSSVGGGHGRFFIVGASGAGARGTGRVYVYDRISATPAFVAESDATGGALGAMFVSVVGDVDADGTPDIFATDFSNSAAGPSSGRSYVYSGTDGRTLLTLTGEQAGEGFGIGPARTGDVDGDGFDDLVIGSWQYGGAAWSGGRVRVFSGRDGRVLQTMTGRVPGETLGFDAVGVGDVDGDGLTDYLVTSAWSLVNGVRSGRVFIVAGQAMPRR